MLREIQLDILANSRLAVNNSFYTPLTIGCIIISTMYGIAHPSFVNLFFMWAWIGFACWTARTHYKNKKLIIGMRKDGR